MLFQGIIRSLINSASDEMMERMLKDQYNENLFVMATAAQKLTLRAIIEASMRAQSGQVLKRAYGSPNVQSPWEKLFLSPTQLFSLPTDDKSPINTGITIGKNAKAPLELSMPIMITGMSYGGSLSLKAKIALAKGATLAGTCTNTGESALSNEEREAAKYLIGQYHRGEWMNTEEQLSKLDAIEVQLGQGAWGGAVPSVTSGEKIDEHLRSTWHLNEGEDAVLKARLTGVNTTQDIINLLNGLKEKYDVPVGIKIAATHYIEKELDVILKTNVDYIVIDGAEGGTAVAPPTLEDDMGLPTLYAIARAAKYLEMKGVKDKYDLIAAGGLKTPGQFLKALALGANAVYIGSIALVAMLQDQSVNATPAEPTPQLVVYDGKLTEDLDIERGANNLNNFLNSCVEEMKLALIAMGKTSFSELSINDLVTVDKDISDSLGIAYAGLPYLE
ncbi:MULTISPECIES: FMN-binding glutamate synthase family protein [Clostridium]|uniref:Glutamate synthase [NADPH] large chain n=1 Tax=Clostridium colicanis DSM 13634 TaxID=1121305 RepID=A0A151AMY1_9CLOT|nr:MULTISPECIES: FMN-binding glutamate synthase family protein [Clostridium]KYH28983.1 glutamate synthase [NADPH] large chain precursor [Clostridium colicanis DSM 13634]MBE6044822.1 FMN-binding glutamate synthase family protein [Clostridium thermopalmarium]